MRNAGFTLVEVMIAIAITAIIGAMTVGSFRQVDRASEIVRGQAERYAAVRVALTRLSRELTMAYLSDHYDRNEYRERPTLFRGREDQVLFATLAHERVSPDVKESDEAVVEYVLEADPDHAGEEALFRRSKPRVDADPERGGRKDVVADRITAFRLGYWDPKRKEWVREWSTRATEHESELPERVRIELETKLPDGRTEKLSTEARIAISRPLDF
ncbi:type II secretion system protein GspJ [Anaeromyxobacter sp. SG17]|uniref:type II secretion system protein GspJ n=1 Tax=Anaeromyxobacter sp. SG17 TaxID=2925405 RepID=UPI001F576461|nr:type II secretion system protein GspJ [Anaeromyxobacter sp. SG17]